MPWRIIAGDELAPRGMWELEVLVKVEALQDRFREAVQLLLDAEGEILTFYDFPPEHRRQIYSTNPLEQGALDPQQCASECGAAPLHARSRCASSLSR
jgi:hypothetical protein